MFMDHTQFCSMLVSRLGLFMHFVIFFVQALFGGFLECLVILGHSRFYKCLVIFSDFARY
jgi:hypothetical protein